MEEGYTFAQVNEIIKRSEETMMKFINSTVDRLENKIAVLTEENITIKKQLAEFNHSLQFHSDLIDDKVKSMDSNKEVEEVRTQNENLLEKVSELEDRNRRNNLRFSGIEEDEEETWESSEEKVKILLKDKLGIEENIQIERAHRTGNRNYHDGSKNTKRTIIIKLLNYKDKRKILDAFVQKKLWEQKLYLNEDFSESTVAKRKELFKKVKELRGQGIKVKVIYKSLVYQNNQNSNVVNRSR